MVCLFEAKTGSLLDRFRVTAAVALMYSIVGARLSAISCRGIEAETFAKAQVCDERPLACRRVYPGSGPMSLYCRQARNVMALGDTAHSLDPIGGQGGQQGNKMTVVFRGGDGEAAISLSTPHGCVRLSIDFGKK